MNKILMNDILKTLGNQLKSCLWLCLPRYLLINSAVILLFCELPAFCFSNNDKEYFCWTGLGIFSGNVTYQIGEPVSEPISKLQFPLNVNVVTFGNEFLLNKSFEIRGEITKNISTSAGKMQDTDYANPNQLPISRVVNPLLYYSSNDSDAQTMTMDIGFRYWVAEQSDEKTRLRFAAGAAMLYEHLEWRINNLNETAWYELKYDGIFYPINPAQLTQRGLVGTYETTTTMPYLELAAKYEYTDSFSLLFSLGYSPFAQITDEDNHLIRQFVATTSATGTAYKLGLQAKYDFSNNWFLMGKWDWIDYDVTGVQSGFYYDGSGYSYTISHEISSQQSILSLSIARKF